MRTYARLEALKQWAYDTVCKGRRMKAEPPDRKITYWQEPVEPAVHIAYFPKRYDETNMRKLVDKLAEQHISTAPSILIMPTASDVKLVEQKRFDQYNGVHRSEDYGQHLNVQVLFSVYEDGLRLPGFHPHRPGDFGFGEGVVEDNEYYLENVREGTQEGLQTLLDWMDDFRDKLLTQIHVPGSDLALEEEHFVYSMRSDQRYIADTRPLYYGLCDIGFSCVAESGDNPEIGALLD